MAAAAAGVTRSVVTVCGVAIMAKAKHVKNSGIKHIFAATAWHRVAIIYINNNISMAAS